MTVDYAIMDKKFEHCAYVLSIIEQMVKQLQPGDYRLNERYPLETIEFARIASSFRGSKVPELAAFGWRLEAITREMDEYDRTCREKAPERTIRRQKRLFSEAMRKYLIAAEALRPLMMKGLI